MTVSSSVLQTYNISTREKRQHRRDVPVFGIINFKFVNTTHPVQGLFVKEKKTFSQYIFWIFLLLMKKIIYIKYYLYYLQHTIAAFRSFIVLLLYDQKRAV